MAQILLRKFFLQFETSCLWQVAQMKSQGILEQRLVTLRWTLSLLKPWAFMCRHESPLLIGRCRPSKRVSRREVCEQTAAPAVREACEQIAVQAHREASHLTRLRHPPSSQLLPLLMSPAPQFKINPALPGTPSFPVYRAYLKILVFLFYKAQFCCFPSHVQIPR